MPAYTFRPPSRIAFHIKLPPLPQTAVYQGSGGALAGGAATTRAGQRYAGSGGVVVGGTATTANRPLATTPLVFVMRSIYTGTPSVQSVYTGQMTARSVYTGQPTETEPYP